MAASVTTGEVSELLSELGLTIPTVLLDPIICQVDKTVECMEAHGYDDCTQKMIMLYACSLMAASSGARRLKSQHAPSGASRSFDYDANAGDLNRLSLALAQLDTAGCTKGLPISVQTVGFFRVVG